jgi:hypothetical protein
LARCYGLEDTPGGELVLLVQLLFEIGHWATS